MLNCLSYLKNGDLGSHLTTMVPIQQLMPAVMLCSLMQCNSMYINNNNNNLYETTNLDMLTG